MPANRIRLGQLRALTEASSGAPSDEDVLAGVPLGSLMVVVGKSPNRRWRILLHDDLFEVSEATLLARTRLHP